MMNIFKPEISNVVAVTHQLLQKLKVHVNLNTLKVNLEAHPEYPSMLAISDCLTDLNIKHQVYQMEKEEEVITELTFPFIAHFPAGDGSFVLVNTIKEAKASIYDGQGGNRVIPEHEFLKLWNGIILSAQPDKNSGEQNYHQNQIQYILKRISLPVYILILLSLFYLLFSSYEFFWANLLMDIIKFTGVCITTLLLIQSINASHPLLKKICGTGKKNGCETILNSDAAKITSWLSWSEIGFFYFTGSFLALLISPLTSPILFWLNISALPYTLYSLVYQYRKKKWCILCCIVQGCLIFEFIIFNTIKLPPLVFNLNLTILLFLCFVTPAAVWGLLKPVLLKSLAVNSLQKQLKMFKYNSNLFLTALKNQPFYEVNNELMPVIMGNPKAKIVVTVISSPFCSACKEAHHFLDKWVQQNDELQVKLLFINENKENDPYTNMARHLMGLSLLEDKNIVILAMNDWFSQSNQSYEDWAKRYPAAIPDNIKAACAKQMKWYELLEISFTPTVLLNGYKLPEPYELEDLKPFIN